LKPLASPIRELRTAAAVHGAGAVIGVVLVAALERTSVVGAIVLALLGAVFFGGGMWLLVYRRFLTDALAAPSQAADDAPRERPSRTIRRTVLAHLPIAVVVIAVALLVPGAAGVLAGGAAGLFAMARGMAAWQRREGALLLREPHYRTQGPGGRTGRGFLDPVDFRRADLR
jgi:hypothetical protein